MAFLVCAGRDRGRRPGPRSRPADGVGTDEPGRCSPHAESRSSSGRRDDLRPGQVGTLLDERADTLDVSATIVDLAVRGYLHIEELPREHWFAVADWKLTRLKQGDDTS